MHFGLARGIGVLRVVALGQQVAVGVELVVLQLEAQGLFGEVFHGHTTGEGAVVQLQRQVFQGQAGFRAFEAADQLDVGQGGQVLHRRQDHADAVEELAQVELGNGNAPADLRLAVQVAHMQLAEGAQLVGGELQAVPFGNVGGQVGQQLALGGEGHALLRQRLAGEFAMQLHVFQLVAAQGAVEAGFAGQLDARPQYRLAGTEESGELERNVHAVMHGLGAQLDAFGTEALAAAHVVVLHPGVVDGKAVDVQLQRTLAGGRLAVAFGWRRRGRRGLGAAFRRLDRQRLADVFPVAVAVFVADQVQVQAFDPHIAHLHFAAQQRQYAYREAEHLQVGDRFGRFVQRGNARLVQLQAEPGEQAPANVAVQGQLDMSLVASQLADLVFVVVGIEEVGQGEAAGHHDQQQPENHQPQDFAERFHGRVLVVGI